MRMQDVIKALANGDAEVVDVTDRLPPADSDSRPTAEPSGEYERDVTLG